ncbi:MAG TPA: M18 family aminopeptidase [Propionibacteriaceae bacterium]|nr:M18 family aminopeptidase [Propionibacteriaceae bacterium]
MTAAVDHLRDLTDFISASPSSFHAAAECARRLRAAGFSQQDETQPWDAADRSRFLIRDGALVAWRLPAAVTGTTAFRVVGSHTDSPTFTLKPNPDVGRLGWQQLGVEVYGEPLLNSWLDRELGLAGRLMLVDGDEALVRTDAIMRIPQLAVHLDRTVNSEGLKLDRQLHTAPIWSVSRPDLGILDHVGSLIGRPAREIVGYDLVAFDAASPVLFGPDQEFFASGRLDNLAGVHASLTAFLEPNDSEHTVVLAAFDHEEIGSSSRSGASGPLLADVLTRILTSLGASVDEQHRAVAGSFCLSTDAGHAVHPNYGSRHDPANHPLLNGGPLLKINANQRYATDARGAALWRRACRRAGVPTQEFVSNNAVPCGSTIGPITASRIGISTVDVGIPLLSMHSVRELAGVRDPLWLAQAIEAFLNS